MKMIDWDKMLPGKVDALDQMPPLEPQRLAAGNLADEIRRRAWDGDNRRRCLECAKRAPNGRCLAAARGEIVASGSYQPDPHQLRRCEGFLPMPDDPDQRSGWDRWPGLPGTRKR